MNILLFGGTDEGRRLAGRLCALGARVTVSVATPLGAEALAGIPGIRAVIGRRDAREMEALLSGRDLCIDATHPYAAQASENIRAACSAAGVPLRRLLRPESEVDASVARAEDCRAAALLLARELERRPGNVLLTTGAKELPAFSALPRHRLFARVLPTAESLAACEAAGLPHRNILALQGPFSVKLNEAMMEQYQIAWLVTKDGGRAGGLPEKLAAARASGVRALLIGRPPDSGETMEEIEKSVREALSWK